MGKFGKELTERAGELTKVVSDDLATGLDLKDANTQRQIASALLGAESDLKSGLAGLQKWRELESISNALPEKSRADLFNAIAEARTALAAAIDFHCKQNVDLRYRLKAEAARWHAEYGKGAIEECPVCRHSLSDKSELRAELDALASCGEVATRKLSDNVIWILAELETALPDSMKRYLSEDVCEAADVHKYWNKTLRSALEKAFKIIREHQALHGGLTALYAALPIVSLPEGRRAAVGAVSLPLVGSAAALSDGKVANGCINLQIDGTAKEAISL